jgi:beta-lactamase regulating signal transducer with metallopeptidase domain
LLVLLKLLSPPLWRIDAGSLLAAPPSASGEATPVLGTEIAGAAEVPGGSDDRAASTAPPAPADRASVKLPVQPHQPAAFHERPADDVAAAKAPARSPKVDPVSPGRWLVWATLLAWAAGSVVCAGVIAARVMRFGRLLRYAEVAPGVVQRLAAVVGGRMGVSGPPQVWFVPGSVCPMLWAVGREPRVLVPRDLWGRLSVRQRSSLLAHELAHVRRRDHWVRVVELLVVVAYWWCPVAWWARRRLREAEEQCCDAWWVVWALPGSGRAYAGAILEAVEFASVGPRLPALASGMGQFALLKRRFAMIRSESVPRTLSWCGRVAVAAAAVALLPLAPSRAQSAGQPGSTVSAEPDVSVQVIGPAKPAPAKVSSSSATVAGPNVTAVSAASPKTEEAAVIGELAIRTQDASDADDDDSQAEARDGDKKEKDKLKEQAKAHKDEAKARLDRDRREARKDGKGSDVDDELAEAREEVRALSKQLEKAAQRLAKLEANRHGWQGDGRPLGSVTPPHPTVPPVPGKPMAPGYGRTGDFPRGKAPDIDAMERSREQRLQQVENRLQALMKEIEAIRREHDAKPRTTPAEPAR